MAHGYAGRILPGAPAESDSVMDPEIAASGDDAILVPPRLNNTSSRIRSWRRSPSPEVAADPLALGSGIRVYFGASECPRP